MAAESKAHATWSGGLFDGKGNVSLDSGAFSELPVTWEGRRERPQGATSPEELISSAHAACLSMSLSKVLADGGNPAEGLDVRATASFEKIEAGFRLTKMHLDVTGNVPGMDAGAFDQAVQAAKDGCPVSNALKGNVEISASSKLQ